jgi:hypothetical protein
VEKRRGKPVERRRGGEDDGEALGGADGCEKGEERQDRDYPDQDLRHVSTLYARRRIDVLGSTLKKLNSRHTEFRPGTNSGIQA